MKSQVQKQTPIATDMFLPNHSGIKVHPEMAPIIVAHPHQNVNTTASPTFVNETLSDTTTSTTGVIFKGTNRFIHNFHHPTGSTFVPDGLNTFIGVDAGNLQQALQQPQ